MRKTLLVQRGFWVKLVWPSRGRKYALIERQATWPARERASKQASKPGRHAQWFGLLASVYMSCSSCNYVVLEVICYNSTASRELFAVGRSAVVRLFFRTLTRQHRADYPHCLFNQKTAVFRRA